MSLAAPGVTRLVGTVRAGLEGSAVFDEAERYRFELQRWWPPPPAGPPMVIIGINPSLANHTHNDPTVTRCVHFAKREGCSGLHMVNLFAMVAVQPSGLLRARDPAGLRFGADEFIRHAVSRPGVMVVEAWGDVPRPLRWRAEEVHGLVRQFGPPAGPLCLGLTRKGQPRHPGRIAYDTPLVIRF